MIVIAAGAYRVLDLTLEVLITNITGSKSLLKIVRIDCPGREVSGSPLKYIPRAKAYGKEFEEACHPANPLLKNS